MAQFLQTQGMSKKPTYLDVMRQEEPKKFNLFDFSSVKTPEPIQTPQMNFGQPISQKNVTNFSDFKKSIPQTPIRQTQPTEQSGFSLFPTANAMEQEDLLQQYLKDPKQDNNSKQQLFKALQDGESPDNIINYLQTNGYKGLIQPTQAIQPVQDNLSFGDVMSGKTDIGSFALGNIGKGLSEAGKSFKFESGNEMVKSKNPAVSSFGNLVEALKFAGNIPGDTIQLVGDLGQMISNPIGTVKTLDTLGKGIVETGLNKIFGTDVYTSEDKKQMVEGVSKALKDNFGTLEKAQNSILENPTDVLLTIQGGLQTAKLGIKNPNIIAKIDKINEAINPINILRTEGAVAGKIAEKTIGQIPKAIKGGGEALYKTAIKPNVNEAELILRNKAGLGPKPTTRADTALKTGLTGTETQIGTKALKEASEIFKKTIGPALDESKAVHNIDDLFKKVELEIQSGKGGELRKQELLKGLEALKDDYSTIGKKQFSTKDLQIEKSSLDEFTPAKVFKGVDVANGYNQVKNTLANIFRQQVRDDLGNVGIPNAKELYRDYANLTELSKIGIKGLTEGGLKGGFGTFWSTLYDKLATPIKTIGGKVLYRTGEGLEFIGPKGIKKVGDYLKINKVNIKDGNVINLSPKLLKNDSNLTDTNILRNSSTTGVGGDTLKPKLLKKSPLSDREKAIIRQEPKQTPKPKVGFKIGDKKPLKKEPTTAEKVVSDTTQANNKPLLKKENVSKTKEIFKKKIENLENEKIFTEKDIDYIDSLRYKPNRYAREESTFKIKNYIIEKEEKGFKVYKDYNLFGKAKDKKEVLDLINGKKQSKPLLKKENLEKAKEMFKKDELNYEYLSNATNYQNNKLNFNSFDNKPIEGSIFKNQGEFQGGQMFLEKLKEYINTFAGERKVKAILTSPKGLHLTRNIKTVDELNGVNKTIDFLRKEFGIKGDDLLKKAKIEGQPPTKKLLSKEKTVKEEVVKKDIEGYTQSLINKRGEYLEISKRYQNILRQIENEKNIIKLKELQKQEKIIGKELNDFANNSNYKSYEAKANIQNNLNSLTKSNIDEIASKITTDTTKLAKVKEVIQKYIKEYGDNIKNYLGLLADDIVDIVGGRAKLLGGENAKLFDKSRWEQAKEMTRAGKSADEVWQKTGWEKGTDGKWRFEIDDSKVNILIKKEDLLKNAMDKIDKGENPDMYNLQDIFTHSDLFKQYPELKDMKIIFDSKLEKEGAWGSYSPYFKEMTINPKRLNNPEELKSTLLHEIQHIIQEKEGFAKGGSPELGYIMAKELENKIDDYNSQLSKLAKENKNTEYEKVMNKKLETAKELRNLQDDFGRAGYEGYKKLAGETEARNIQTRLNKTPAERKLLRPEKTEDVERSKQIVKMEGGKAMSMSDDLISEAKKYKSFDEFKKSQGEPIYHGSKNKFEQFDSKFTKTSSNRADRGVGTYFTDNKNIAQEYAKDNGFLYTTFINKEKSKMINWDEPLKSQKDKNIIRGIVQEYLEPNKNRYPEKGLIIDIENSLNKKDDFGIIYEYLTSVIDEKELSKILNSKGFDGIISKDYGMGGNVYTIFNANQIKTEAQLKSIYEQATKPKLLKKATVSDDMKPLSLYHGTSKEIAGDFKGGFFTEDIKIAEKYKSSGASGLAKDEVFMNLPDKPGIYKTEIDTKRVFDINNSKNKKIFEEFLKTDSLNGPGYGVGPNNKIDWSEGTYITDYLKRKYKGKYDWVILDGMDNGAYYAPINPKDVKLTKVVEGQPKLLKKATVSDDLIDGKINWDKQLDKKFTYKINCVDCDDGAKIGKMVDGKFDEEITYKDFLKAVSEEDIRKVLKIPSNINVDNWANKFYRSMYEGEPAYYIQSSGVEWVWTNKNKIKLTKPKLLKKAN